MKKVATIVFVAIGLAAVAFGVARVNRRRQKVETLAVEPTRGTLAEQKACSDEAEKSFKNSFSKDEKSNLANAYTSHYEPASHTCFIEITAWHALSGTSFQYSRFIYDAQGNLYGKFTSESKALPPDECSIKPRGHFEIICKSGDEFDRLALLYFGTLPE